MTVISIREAVILNHLSKQEDKDRLKELVDKLGPEAQKLYFLAVSDKKIKD